MSDTDAIRATPSGRHRRRSGLDDGDGLGTVLRALSGNLDADTVDVDVGAPPEEHRMSPLWTRLAAARTVLIV